VGEHAPDFTLPDAGGRPVTLADYRGNKPVVIVFYRGYW
jgi:peroxiredoxin